MPTIIPLDRIDDPRLADYVAVSDPELVRRRGLFVAEGRLVVERVLGTNRSAIRSLLLNPAAFSAMRAVIDTVPDSVPVYVCAADQLKRLLGIHLHRGCLALVERPAKRTAGELIRGATTLVVLERLANADNVGSIFRNAAAFAADAVLLSPTTCDPLYRKAIRTSMGATLQVPYARLDSWPADLALLRDAGFIVVGLTPRSASLEIDQLRRTVQAAPVAILLGTEGAGLTPATDGFIDLRVRIPMAKDVDSLNVAVAAGIALSSLSRLRD